MKKLPGYEAALTKAAFYPQPEAGYLRIGGADRVSFLQRQSTNDLQLLTLERPLVTVLTSPTARILDVLTLFIETEGGEERVSALTLPGRGHDTASFLRSRIFFMDQVEVEDASAEFAQVDLLGPGVGDVLRQLGLALPAEEGGIQSGQFSGQAARVLDQPGWGYRLLLSQQAASAALDALASASAARLDPEGCSVLRVEAGLPHPGRELTEEYTPLETGLDWAISDHKGCYTGQEVIARQITYDKITRRLVGLKLEKGANPGDRLWPQDENRPAGAVTSPVYSPRYGHIALAIVRRPFEKPGTILRVADEDRSARATVTSLPFKTE